MSANSLNTSIRRPAVAGFFYPADPAELSDTVSELMTRASATGLPATALAATGLPATALPWNSKAYIVPHAGYIYSGSTAASAYVQAAQQQASVRRIVLIGPSHRVYLNGAALPRAQAFATPLGDIPIERELKDRLLDVPGMIESDHPHQLEHSLEVQLPFLQVAFKEFTILPIVVGDASAAQIAAALDAVWGEEETLILASSDLSHYHAYREAQLIDARTSAAILSKQTNLSAEQACGAVAINGLLYSARERNLQVAELARCNSGDTAGDRDRVVGYGAYALSAGSTVGASDRVGP